MTSHPARAHVVSQPAPVLLRDVAASLPASNSVDPQSETGEAHIATTLTTLHLSDTDRALWRRYWHDDLTAADSDFTLILQLGDLWKVIEAHPPTLTRVAERLTTRDGFGWLCATLPGGVPAHRYAPVHAYATVPRGWAFYAAGISPGEAPFTTPTSALAIAALRGHTLPDLVP